MASKLGTSLPIILNKGYNPLRFDVIGNEASYNLFEFEKAMIPTAGFEENRTISSTGKGRGIFYSDVLSQYVGVFGNEVYSISPDTHTLLGNLATSIGKVYITENALTNVGDDATGLIGGQVAISDGKHIYVYNLDGSFIQAKDDTGSDLPFTPGVIDFEDTFFVVNDSSSNRVYASNINDARIFPVLNFALTDSETRACTSFEKIVFVFGKDITTLYVAQAQSFGFPFTQDVSRSWEYGCLSPESLANGLGVMVWLANSRYSNAVILASTGGSPKPISTAGIDTLIDGFTTPEDSTGFIYQADGHLFYQINFITDNVSLLYDFETRKWTRLSDRLLTDRSIILQSAFSDDQNVLMAISDTNGILYDFGLQFYTHGGNVVPRSIITENYTFSERPVVIKELDLQIEQGANEATSKICLSVSKDRGRTYPIQKVITLGNIGSRQNLLRFRRLGSARWFTFKFDFFSTDRFVILGAEGFIG